MTGFSKKSVLIDGRGHLLGRLAATIAKSLLKGIKIRVVRSEEINISGHFFRSKIKYLSFLNKRCNINPARGPFHYRAPSRILLRTVRGMLPHKTNRGKLAMKRFKAFEGIPPPYCNRTRVVVPTALRMVCLKPGRKYCKVGRLSSEVGWKYQKIVDTLEAKRKARDNVSIKKRNKLKKITKQAHAKMDYQIKPFQQVIQSYGYN